MVGEYNDGASVLFCFILTLYNFTSTQALINVNCTELAGKHCERESEFYNSTTYDGSRCGDLNYCEQQAEHCFIKDKKEWNCLLQKARMMNHNSKACWSPDGDAAGMMHYVEVCAFADDDYECNPNCTITKAHQIKCLNKPVKHREKCIPSLVYCSPYVHRDRCVLHQRINLLQQAFFENCFEPYEEEYGKHEIWYYVDRAHHDNISETYSAVMPVIPLRVGDVDFLHQKLCPQKLPRYGIILITIFGLLVASIAIFGAWKFRKYQKQQEEHWNDIEQRMQATFDASIPMMPLEDDPLRDLYEQFVPDSVPDLRNGNHGHHVDGNGNSSHPTYQNGNGSTQSPPENGTLPHQDDGTTKCARSVILANHTYTGKELRLEENNNGASSCMKMASHESGSLFHECEPPIGNHEASPQIGSYVKHTAFQ